MKLNVFLMLRFGGITSFWENGGSMSVLALVKELYFYFFWMFQPINYNAHTVLSISQIIPSVFRLIPFPSESHRFQFISVKIRLERLGVSSYITDQLCIYSYQSHVSVAR